MRVLVTGANGHLGYNLVQALLAAGHQVRASVRSLDDVSKTARLKALGSVELVQAELHRRDELRAAMEDIEVLFHAAAVYTYADRSRATEMQAASVAGTEKALRAAADARVRKVVLTSSIVTVPFTRPGAPPTDESSWQDDLRTPYIRAKTEGERTAWRLASQLRLNLVTVLPGAATGPGFARSTPSIDMVEALMRGAMRMGAPDMNFPLVDVRDVVSAHLLAAERDCEGRFIACNDVLPTFHAMLEAMRAIDPLVPRPLMTMPDFVVPLLPWLEKLNHLTIGAPLVGSPEFFASMRGKVWNASNRRAKEVLGWQQTVTMEQTLGDTMAALRARDG
jgi:dihydroflavonol-4-reductase